MTNSGTIRSPGPSTITGTFNADKTVVSFDTIPDRGGATFKLDNAPMDNTTVKVADSTWDGQHHRDRVSAPVVTTDTTTTPGTESVKNHGQFVKAQGGGKVAAQACAGMPLNSTQGRSNNTHDTDGLASAGPATPTARPRAGQSVFSGAPVAAA